MIEVKALREQLAKVDGHRRFADDAESARVKIRLSSRPVARGGLLGFLRGSVWRDEPFTQAETNAIYVALGQVRDEERRAARELEKKIVGGEA